MKDLVISVVLFSILIACMIGNSIFITNGTKDLKAAVETIPPIESPDCRMKIDELRALWQKFKGIAQLSLNYTELNKMECLIDEIDCHRQEGNENDFEHARVVMLNLLGEIVRLEKISVDGIF